MTRIALLLLLLLLNICNCEYNNKKTYKYVKNTKAFATGLKVSVDGSLGDISDSSSSDISNNIGDIVEGSSAAESTLPFSPFIPISLFVRTGAKLYLKSQINKVRWVEIFLSRFQPTCNIWTCMYNPKYKIYSKPSKLEIELNDGQYDMNKYTYGCNKLIDKKELTNMNYEKSSKNSYELLTPPYNNKLEKLGVGLYNLCKGYIDPYKSLSAKDTHNRAKCFSEQGWIMKGHLDYHLALWSSVNKLFKCITQLNISYNNSKNKNNKSILIKNSSNKKAKSSSSSTTKTVRFELNSTHKLCNFNELYDRAVYDMNALLKRLAKYNMKKSSPCYNLWHKSMLIQINK